MRSINLLTAMNKFVFRKRMKYLICQEKDAQLKSQQLDALSRFFEVCDESSNVPMIGKASNFCIVVVTACVWLAQNDIIITFFNTLMLTLHSQSISEINLI